MPTTAASGRLSLFSAQQAWTLAGIVALAAAAAAASLLLEADGFHIAALIAIGMTGLAAIACFYRSWRVHFDLRQDLAQLQRRYAEVYGRAGISIWQEDWSAVGQAIARLRTGGVTDIPAWFAARPDEARALHAQIAITDVNRHSVRLMRAAAKADLLGSLGEVLPGSSAAFGRWLTALCGDEELYVGESVIQRCDGEPFDCLVTAALPRCEADFAQIVVSIIEITAYKRDQARLAEARDDIARTQRIATVGALTASIAHEVNSPLAAVASNASACLRWLQRPEPELAEAAAAAEAVLVEVDRARAVIDRTRSYLQKADRREELRDLRGLIRDAIQLVQREAEAHEVSVSLDLADDLGPVRCDPVQLQQALVNLLVNGIQAMSDSPRERRLILSARRCDRGLAIGIEDTGIGIASDDLRRVFEPFYSTRSGGMGMGLAICRTAIEAHGGTIAVRSTPGQETRFDIVLPEAAA